MKFMDKEKKKEKKKKKKGSYGKVFGFCAVVACVATLFGWLGGGGFGFGGGGGFGLPFGSGGNGGSSGDGNGGSGYVNENGTYNNEAENNDNETSGGEVSGDGASQETVLLEIRVSGNSIYHGDQEIAIDELVPLFEELNQPGSTWELHDDQDIMETFENVRALMRENGIVYAIQ